MIVNGTMLMAGVEEVLTASRLVRSDKTNVAMNIVISGLFCDFTQRRMVVPYRRFGTTYRAHLQGSSLSKFFSDRKQHIRPEYLVNQFIRTVQNVVHFRARNLSLNPVHRRFVCLFFCLFVRSFVSSLIVRRQLSSPHDMACPYVTDGGEAFRYGRLLRIY